MFRFPEKHKVEYEGETIEYVVAGDGPGTIVLVNGSGGPIEGWHKVFNELAGVARVFAYNRPGVGGSAKPRKPQTGSHMIALLRAALAAAGCRQPYVLVGHSFGGLIVNLFARRHPSDVAAVVMLEATSVDDVDLLPAHETRLQRFVAKLANRLFPLDPNTETMHAGATVSEIRAAPPFPPIPLTVVTGGKPAMTWATSADAMAARRLHQRELTSLTPLGRQVLAMKSGHFPQFSEPDMVIAVVKEAMSTSGSAPGRTGITHSS
ncbi:MAG TPA: alpha/beta hydrolase [Noviherbaspirillum sp.]|nr:alpha/beta hydrolase [Noviherbaspirillum sp.]